MRILHRRAHALWILGAAFITGCALVGQSRTLVIQGATLIDRTGRPALTDSVVVVHDGRFNAVGKRGDVSIPAGAEIIDARGKTILPGLIDGHCHYRDWMGEIYLAYGVLTCPNISNNPVEWIIAQREGVKNGSVRGPRVWASANIIDGPPPEDAGGLRRQRTSIIVDSEEEARKAVRSLVDKGVDGIKLFERLKPQVAKAAADEARKLGRPVFGHSLDIFTAAENGYNYAATANWIVSGIGEGKDLVFFANTGYSVLKLLSHPSITRPGELKGKRIGTGEANSSQDRITRQALQRLGLDPDKDVTLVPMGQRSITRLNALLKGEIDATTSNEDNIFDLERRGEIHKVRILADNESLKLFIGGGVDFAMTRSLLTNARHAAKGFLQALCEAIALARRERAHADRIYTRYLNVKDPTLLEFMYRTYVHGAIPERPYARLENVALGIEEFGAKPGLKGKRAEDLTDLTLMKELEQQGLFKPAGRQLKEHGKYGE
ncbi:MAG TPA: ABC transporter substrate-binding protein [Candidatus Binatia bacterium]|nr:ABC transporter substrate-binding protein [Candidatus Binatia bacterium]